MLLGNFIEGAALKHGRARQEVIDYHPQRVHIGSGTGRLA